MPEESPGVLKPLAAAAAWLGVTAAEIHRMSTAIGGDGGGGDAHGDAADVGADPGGVLDDDGGAHVEEEVRHARARRPPVTAARCAKVLEEIAASLAEDCPDVGEGVDAAELHGYRRQLGECIDRMRLAMNGLPSAGDGNAVITMSDVCSGVGVDLQRIRERLDAAETRFTAEEKAEDTRKWSE